jgi:hypothetical protein
MQFNANQMREAALPKTGRYHFTVLHTREKTSKNGNDMFIFKLRLTRDGKSFNFFSTIILTPKMFWQFEHFCKATGIPEKIDEGNLMAQECDGLEGFLEMDHRANSETGEIEAYVKDFVKPENLDQVDKNELPFLDDDIPPLV